MLHKVGVPNVACTLRGGDEIVEHVFLGSHLPRLLGMVSS